MEPSRRHIAAERRGEWFCVRLRQDRLDENEVYELAEELRSLVADEGCRRMALALGPDRPAFLYSIFLAKLITLQRELNERGGELVLSGVGPEIRSIFTACGLDGRFHFFPDFDSLPDEK